MVLRMIDNGWAAFHHGKCYISPKLRYNGLPLIIEGKPVIDIHDLPACRFVPIIRQIDKCLMGYSAIPKLHNSISNLVGACYMGKHSVYRLVYSNKYKYQLAIIFRLQ